MKKRKRLSRYAINFLEHVKDHHKEHVGVYEEDVVKYFGKVVDQGTLRVAITEYFGPRCGEDWSSYLHSESKDGICGCCEAWLAFDRFTGTVYPAAIIEGL